MPLLTILFFCSWTFNLAAIVFVVIFPSAVHTAETEVGFLQTQPGLYCWSFRSSCLYVLYLALILYFCDHDRTGFSGPAEELPCVLKHVPSQEGSLLSHRTRQEIMKCFSSPWNYIEFKLKFGPVTGTLLHMEGEKGVQVREEMTLLTPA